MFTSEGGCSQSDTWKRKVSIRRSRRNDRANAASESFRNAKENSMPGREDKSGIHAKQAVHGA